MPTDVKNEEGRALPREGRRLNLRLALAPSVDPRARTDAMRFRPDGLTCPRAQTGTNVVQQREPWADPMDTNRLLIIAAAIVLALVLVWYLLPRSTPPAPTATPPPATTPAQPQQ